jgi:hypothetical protein
MKRPLPIKLFFYLLLPVFLFSQIVFQSGCANIIPPEGGPRDTTAPVLVKVTPPNATTGFGDTRITFTFDEYVDLDNYQQNMIVSPLPSNFPNVSRKLNTITIRIRDTLQPNTTYAFDFGNTIKDVNESNVMKNFTYIFSTGRYLDSLQLSGRVIDAETGNVDSTMVVMLHTDKDDSAVVKKRPRYIAKVNGNGTFLFKNLPPDTFYVYALKDEGAYRYLSGKQSFAFADAPVFTGADNDSLVLRSYVSQKDDQGTRPAAPNQRGKLPPGENRLKFSTNLNANKQDILGQFIMTFETPLKNFDSSRIRLSTDTLFTPVPGYSWQLDTTRKILTLVNVWQENTAYNLVLEKDFATDTLGRQLLKGDTLNFTTTARNEYGKLSIRFRNLDLSKNPVLVFIIGEGSGGMLYPMTSETFTRELFPPGEYNLRILYDSNKNGKWDPGQFFGKHIQPELVKPVPRKLNVRPNWDNLFEIAL